MAQALILGSDLINALKALDARAAMKPTDYERVVLLARGHITPSTARELNREMTIQVPVGYAVTLTYEQQRPHGGLCRHASLSHPNGINPAAAQVLLTGLGFTHTIGEIPMWVEKGPELPGGFAANFLEPVSGDLSELATR